MSQTLRSLTILTLLAWVAGCGGNSNSVRGVMNGQQFEAAAQGAICDAVPSDPSTAPVACRIDYRTAGYFNDYLAISVNDVRPIYKEFLNQPIQLNPGLLAQVTYQGQIQVIVDGFVTFTQISNVAGGEVCAKYEIYTGNGLLNSDFCATVRAGY